MQVGDVVKLYGQDQYGRSLVGMTAMVTRVGAIYAHVAVNMWALEEVMVLLFDCRPHDETPMSVAQWRAHHMTWEERNRRVIRRMSAIRAERRAA